MQNLDGWIVGAEGHHHICKAPQKTWINYERAHQVCVIVLHIKILGQFRVRASNAKDTINQWGLPPPSLFFYQRFSLFVCFWSGYPPTPPTPFSEPLLSRTMLRPWDSSYRFQNTCFDKEKSIIYHSISVNFLNRLFFSLFSSSA